MEWINTTPFPAMLFRSVLDEDRMMAAVIARVTYDLRDGKLHPAAEQIWPVSPSPYSGPTGIAMESDEVFYRGGVDLMLFGHACAPRNRPVSSLRVKVQCGAFERQIAVFGDRTWEGRPSHLRPSAPALFERIPLTLEHAFGGVDVWDELPVPFPDNPKGRGFYLSPVAATGKLLPNLEQPATLIGKWDDRPDPVGTGCCPMAFSARLREGVKLDEGGRLQSLNACLFNAAFPDFVAEQVTPGMQVRVEGVQAEGLLLYEVPALPFHVRINIGATDVTRPLYIDQMGIEADHKRVFIAYRYPWRYTVMPHDRRVCELQAAA